MDPRRHTDEFLLVHADPWFHRQERFGLVPKNGKDGVVRRALIFTLLAWLPLVVWALVAGRAFDSVTGEPLLRHYSVHARFLLALPALILGERMARSTLKRLLPRFVQMGLVSEENCAKDGGGLGFRGWWFLVVARPIYQLFLFSWLWRVVLLFVIFRRILKLGLDLLPAHPDRLGGLGFIPATPRGFAPLKNVRRKGIAEYGALVARHDRMVSQTWLRGQPVAIARCWKPPNLGLPVTFTRFTCPSVRCASCPSTNPRYSH
jgi:hypothetical protein